MIPRYVLIKSFYKHNITTTEIHPSEIRWNLYYMAIFRSGIDLLATIIIPACLLGYWNFYTQTIIKRRAKILLINEKMKQTRSERQKPKHIDSFTLTFQTIDQLVAGMYYLILIFFFNTKLSKYFILDQRAAHEIALNTIKTEETRKVVSNLGHVLNDFFCFQR